MRYAARLLTLSGCLLATLGMSLPLLGAPAAAQGVRDEAGCTTTGYVVEGGQDPAAVRDELSASDAFSAQGAPLLRMQPEGWVLADGSVPLVVVDSTEELSTLSVEVYVAGQRVYRWRELRETPGNRYAAVPKLPMLGDLTRNVGLVVESGPCGAMTVATVDRSLWSTRAGQVGLVLTALFAAALVTVARWRHGGWWRRFLWAAPLGLLAGAAEVAVWHEAGRLDPFGGVPWWPFALGLAFAGLLPLTRRRRRNIGHLPQPVTVRQLMASGVRLTGPQVATLTVAVLGELSAAHARGLRHPVRPESILVDGDHRVWLADPGPPAPPYASPEQMAGQLGDVRSDVWACGVVLAELLTGHPAAPSDLPDLPASLAEVVGRALAVDPAQRYESAEAFAAALRAAADQEWGPDWVGRGALTGALLAHGAIGSAATGYTAAGLGAGAPAGMAGLGAAAPAGTGALGAVSGGVLSGTSTGALGSAGATLVAAGPAVAGGAGSASALISVGAAVAAVVAVGAGAVLTEATPAQANPVVITPEQARVLVIHTLDQARSGQTEHLAEEVANQFTYSLLTDHEALADARIAEVVVGVPPDQYDFPAWFVASAQLRFDGGVVHLWGQFERAAASARWQMATMTWLLDEPVGQPRLDDDGWLVAVPAPGELLIDPVELPQRYADWSQASFDAARHLPDDLLQTRELGDDRETIRDYRVRSAAEAGANGSVTQEIVLDDAEPTVVWLADGSALVSFTVISRQTTYNTPRPGQTRACEGGLRFFWVPDQDIAYRQLSYYATVQVEAWVPTRDSGHTTVMISDPRPVQRLDSQRSVPC